MTEPLNLAKICNEWLQQCDSCDAGLPMSCTCPQGDYRPVMLRLVDEVDRLRSERNAAYGRGRDDEAASLPLRYEAARSPKTLPLVEMTPRRRSHLCEVPSPAKPPYLPYRCTEPRGHVGPHRAAGTGELLAEWPNQITMYRDDEDLIARWREAVKSGRVIVLDSRSTRRRWWHRLQPRWWR